MYYVKLFTSVLTKIRLSGKNLIWPQHITMEKMNNVSWPPNTWYLSYPHQWEPCWSLHSGCSHKYPWFFPHLSELGWTHLEPHLWCRWHFWPYSLQYWSYHRCHLIHVQIGRCKYLNCTTKEAKYGGFRRCWPLSIPRRSSRMAVILVSIISFWTVIIFRVCCRLFRAGLISKRKH